MSKKRRKRRSRPRKSARPRRQAGGGQLMTPEGDALVFMRAHYQHTAPEEIRQVLMGADDFGIDENMEAEVDGSFCFPRLETRPGEHSWPLPIGQRVLAQLTLRPTTLEVEAMSQRRLDDCCQRLEELLGDHIHLIRTESKDVDHALRERAPRAEPKEPLILPPEVIAEIEEKMLRQWIDDSIPALGGLTPREAVKTPEGRQRLLDLIDYISRDQEARGLPPGMFSPDYRKAKKMLGLE
jgi:hypothetical protein